MLLVPKTNTIHISIAAMGRQPQPKSEFAQIDEQTLKDFVATITIESLRAGVQCVACETPRKYTDVLDVC